MTISDIDYDIRKINSFVLRLVLVLCLIIILFFNKNLYTKETYFLFFLGYIVIQIINYKYCWIKYRGILRLIFDLTLITICLQGKNIGILLNYLPFILLLSNIQNHSNKNGNILYFIFFFHLDLLILDNFKFNLTHQLIPLLFYLFNFIYTIRNSFLRLNEQIINSIGETYVDTFNENISHRILNDAVKGINKSRALSFLNIKELFLFIKSNNRLVLVKGSKFVINQNIISEAGFIKLQEKLSEKVCTLIEDKVLIDNVLYESCFWTKHIIRDKEYFFLISLNGKNKFLGEFALTKLRPIFEYITRVFYVSNTLLEYNTQTTKIFKQKITYVLDAQNALHFVKNKLSPITASLDLIHRYFNQREEYNTPEKIKYIENRLRNNINSKQIEIILGKAEVLIKGVDNIISQEDVTFSVKDIIDDLRKNWVYHFQNTDNVVIEIENFENKKIKYNQMLFEFVFSDITENISKYSEEGKNKVGITIVNNILIIDFTNKIKDYDKKISELLEIEQLYNLKDNDQIYARKTHGLNFIRLLLRRKNINNKVIINKEEQTFTLRIQLNLNQDENTNF